MANYFSKIKPSVRDVRVGLAAAIVAGLVVFLGYDVINGIYVSIVHPITGEWEDRKCKTTLSVFGDKTAIYDSTWGKSPCVWSQKSRGLAVLKCNIFRDADKTLIFKVLPNGEAMLDDIQMRRPTHEAGSAAHYFSCERQ
jgi:hypothetical protein